jgi:hypothetical protein
MRSTPPEPAWQPGELSDDECRLLRLFRCLEDGERGEALRAIAERLTARYSLDPYLARYSDPQKELEEERECDLDWRLCLAMPVGSWLTELEHYDYHIEHEAWTNAAVEIADVILGTSEWDHQYIEDLVNAYLRAAYEYHIDLMTSFGATEEEMTEEFQREATSLIRAWRESVVSLMEKQARDSRGATP